jgi:biotin carboxylase
MAQCLLVLGAGYDQRYLIKTAVDMGYEVAAVDRNPDAVGFDLATYSAPVSFSDVESVCVWVDKLRASGVDLGGVLSMGVDRADLLGIYGRKYGFFCPSRSTIRNSADKAALRHWIENCVSVPRGHLVEEASTAFQLWDAMGCGKIVIKPIDNCGSRGVSIIDSDLPMQEIRLAMEKAKSESGFDSVLVQEYIPGPQISSETLCWDGRHLHLGFSDRNYRDTRGYLPQPLENGGTMPSSLDYETRRSVEKTIEATAEVLGIKRGWAKGDLVIDAHGRVYVLEMAARLSGGDFNESLVPLSTGINYMRSAVEMAFGREPLWDELTPTIEKYAANRYFFTPSGRYDGRVQIGRKCGGVKKFEMWMDHGEELKPITDHAGRRGVFCVQADDQYDLEVIIDQMYQNTTFKIDGEWCSGDPRYHAGCGVSGG